MFYVEKYHDKLAKVVPVAVTPATLKRLEKLTVRELTIEGYTPSSVDAACRLRDEGKSHPREVFPVGARVAWISATGQLRYSRVMQAEFPDATRVTLSTGSGEYRASPTIDRVAHLPE